MLAQMTFAGAFAAGLLSFLSPCILPLVLPYLCFLTGSDLSALKTADKSLAQRSFIRALFFVAGFSVVFVTLGATASTLGQWLTRWYDLLSMIAGALIVVLGLHFLGLFRVLLFFRELRFSARAPASHAGAFVVGLAFAFGWTPCVGPVLASILIVAGAQDTVLHGMALLGSYALGIGVPFLAASFFVGAFTSFLNTFRSHIALVERVIGLIMVVTGLLFITGLMPSIGNWLLEKFPSLGQIG